MFFGEKDVVLNFLMSCKLGFLISFVLTLIAGCSSNPGEYIPFLNDDGPKEFEFNIVASSNINPDRSGRPSPLVVTIYQLSNAQRFNSLDVISLISEDENLLGGDLLGKRELTLLPGQSLREDLQTPNQTRYLGVFAAFQNIEGAISKVVFQIDGSHQDQLCISVEGIHLSTLRDC